MASLWQEVRDALPAGAHFHRVSASAGSDGTWFAIVEVHRYHDEGGSLHIMNRDVIMSMTPEESIDHALRDVLAQCREIGGTDDAAD